MVNNIVLDNPRASVIGTAVSVRTFYLNNNTTPRFEGSGSGSSTNSFGTNYLVLEQGNGANYVEFTPNIIVAGDYTIYQWHPFRAESSQGFRLKSYITVARRRCMPTSRRITAAGACWALLTLPRAQPAKYACEMR